MTLGERYGEAACNTAIKLKGKSIIDKRMIILTWREECKRSGMKLSLQDYMPPRTTFRILCEINLLKEIKVDYVIKETEEEIYSNRIVNALKAIPKHITGEKLREEIMRKTWNYMGHSYRIDVILALWEKGLIVE